MALFFSDDFIHDVSSANDIVDVISSYVALKKAGRNMVGLCPFHQEKTPSFSVSPEKQFYHCFGCGVGGNVIDFIMRIENLDFVETIKFLAERAHIPIEEQKQTDRGGSKKELIYQMNKEAAHYFHACLLKSDTARHYLLERGLSQATIKHFGLGYAPDSWTSLIDFLKAKKYTEQQIFEAGLAGKKETRYYDTFRNRIIFPIIDLRGNVIGFGGRVLDDSKPKYLNSPESPVFNKSRNLYGLNFAKNSDLKSLLIVEGYMDVIALHQADVTNAVAALGTAFTPEHAKIIKRYAQEVILCFDTDQAGQTATMRCIEIMSKQGLPIRVLQQDRAKDPDEFIKNFGKDAFLQLMKSAPNFIEYRIARLREEFDISQIEQKIRFVQEAAKVFVSLESDVEAEAYVKKIAHETDISADAIFSEMKKLSGRQRPVEKRSGTDKTPAKPLPLNKRLSAERMLLGLLYDDSALLEKVGDRITDYLFSVPEHKELFRLIGEQKKLSHMLLSDTQKEILSEIAVRDFHIDDKFHAALQLIQSIQQMHNIQMIQKQKETEDANALQQLLLNDIRSKQRTGEKGNAYEHK